MGFLRGRSGQPKGGTHSSQQRLWAQLLPLPWDAKAFPGNERLQPLPAPASGRRKGRTAPVFLGLLHFQRRLRGAGPQEKPISSASGRDNISAKQSEISSGSCLQQNPSGSKSSVPWKLSTGGTLWPQPEYNQVLFPVFYRYLISQPHVFNVPPAPLRAQSTSTALGDLCAPRSTAPLVSPSETKDSQ